MIRKAFSEGVHRIYAECDPCNMPSWKLLERLGFIREAHFRKNVFFWKDRDDRPVWKDTYVYSLLNEQDLPCGLPLNPWQPRDTENGTESGTIAAYKNEAGNRIV